MLAARIVQKQVLKQASPESEFGAQDFIAPSSGDKGPRQVRRIRWEVQKHLGGTLKHLIETDPDGLPVIAPRPKSPDDEVVGLLQTMIPWDTAHAPGRRGEYVDLIAERVRPDAKPSWDMDAIHLLLDQPRCFQVVVSWNPSLEGRFNQWLLPLPHRSLP